MVFNFVSNSPLAFLHCEVSLTFRCIFWPTLNWNSCFLQTLMRAAEQSIKQKCKPGVCKRMTRVEDLLWVPPFPSYLFISFSPSLPAWVYLKTKESVKKETHVAFRLKKKISIFLTSLPSITADPSYGLYYSLCTALIHWILPSISTGWWLNPHPLTLSLIWSPRCMR